MLDKIKVKVVFGDNQNEDWKKESIEEIVARDWILYNSGLYDDSYDVAWENICNAIDDGKLPDDWYVRSIKEI